MIQKYPNLCKPITLGRVTFRNRMFSAPMGAENILLRKVTRPNVMGLHRLGYF